MQATTMESRVHAGQAGGKRRRFPSFTHLYSNAETPLTAFSVRHPTEHHQCTTDLMLTRNAARLMKDQHGRSFLVVQELAVIADLHHKADFVSVWELPGWFQHRLHNMIFRETTRDHRPICTAQSEAVLLQCRSCRLSTCPSSG